MIGAESSNWRGRIIQTPRGRIIQIGAEFVGAEFVRGRIVQLPYKLMNIASPYNKFTFFQRILISPIFKKNQN